MKINLVDIDTYLAVLRKSNYCCGYCDTNLDDQSAVVNFKTPKALGGTVTLSNLVASCKTCDKLKGHKDIEEFRSFIFQKISGDINKAFSTLEKFDHLLELSDIQEIEHSMVTVKILLREKDRQRKIVFAYEKLENFRENGLPLPETKKGKITVSPLLRN